jgi:DNA-binding NarL/FixJ family response regulator
VRVVIAEDLFLLREGLASFLKDHGFEIAEAVGSGPELARALSFHQPDVSIIDIRLPPTYTDEGLRAALDARRQLPGLPVLILSGCSPTSSSPTPCGRWRGAAPSWTRMSSPSCWPGGTGRRSAG